MRRAAAAPGEYKELRIDLEKKIKYLTNMDCAKSSASPPERENTRDSGYKSIGVGVENN